MKRKVLQAGNTSVSVSLPKSYVEKHGIEVGDEVEVQHKGTTLQITCETPSRPPKEIDVPATQMADKQRFYYELIGALFMQGANTFTLHLETKDQVETIRSILQKGRLNIYEQDCDGLTLVLHSPATEFDKDALHNLIDRVIKHLYQHIDTLQQHMEDGAISDSTVDSMEDRDEVVNDKVDICRRIINQHVGGHESTALYNFIDKLERIGNEITFLARQASRSDLSGLVQYVDQIKESLFTLQRAHDQFSLDRLDEFDSVYDELIEQVRNGDGYPRLEATLTLIRDSFSDLLVHNL